MADGDTKQTPPPHRLEQFGQVMSYLQYENSVAWDRANFYLLASTALLGLGAASLLPLGKAPEWEKVIILSVLCLAGLRLSYLWKRMLDAADYWQNYWHEILRNLEPEAFGELKLFRVPLPEQGGPARPRVRELGRQTLMLFVILWGLLLAYVLFHAVTHACGHVA